MTPKAAACCGGLAIFDDQASVPVGEPATSNLNVAGGDIVPNLVLARVGAGGKIRIYNWLGPTHMVADVAGWIDTGGLNANGSGFTGVTPSRIFDSRNDIGTTAARSPRRNPLVQIAGRAGVPTNADVSRGQHDCHPAAGLRIRHRIPDRVALPVASNLNYVAGTTRANLAVVKVGTEGRSRSTRPRHRPT